VIPRRGARPVPNLEHLILMWMTVAAALLTLREFTVLHAGPIPHLWVAWVVGAALTLATAGRMVGRANRPRP
jgi:hypothetical protein